LAAGFLNADVPSLHTWQRIFVFEGIISALLDSTSYPDAA